MSWKSCWRRCRYSPRPRRKVSLGCFSRAITVLRSRSLTLLSSGSFELKMLLARSKPVIAFYEKTGRSQANGVAIIQRPCGGIARNVGKCARTGITQIFEAQPQTFSQAVRPESSFALRVHNSSGNWRRLITEPPLKLFGSFFDRARGGPLSLE